MSIEIREIGIDLLPLYSEIPESSRVNSVFRIELIDRGLGGLRFIEEKVSPYVKWDERYEDDSGPASWSKRFDIGNWGIFMAFKGSQPVGGVAVAIDIQAGMTTPFESEGTAILWDLRVHPDERRRGIGSKLFKYAADWARRKGYRQLKIETQNVNVPACRFYAKQGCVLGAIHRYGYASLPDVAHESMLLWYLEL